jgi:uncharacterized protein
MRISATILFLTIFTAVLGLVSYYIFIRGLQAIPPESSLRNAYAVAFWFIAFSFIGSRLLENILPGALADFLMWAGSFWLAAVIYFLIAVVLLDLLRLVNHFLPCFPGAVIRHYSLAKYSTFAGIIGLVGLLLIGGHINSLMPRITTLHIAIKKKSATMKKVNVVAVSDMHLGAIIGRSRLDSIVNSINALDPDLVLLPGDIVDENLTPVIKQNLGEALKNIKSRLGVFAVTGNHEFIGGAERACDYLTRHNITMLRDQSIKVGGSFYLVGREDRMMSRFVHRRRKDLAELMVTVDKTCPVILMDHEPVGLGEAALQGVDLQLSGHTHNGQLWPITCIVRSLYELAWGYKRIADTHYYVSSGIGTWGPPVRIGNRPEIVNLFLTFE